MNDPTIKQPSAHYGYGDVIYVVSLLSLLICTVGEFVAVARPGHNYLNPHSLFYNIWQGHKPDQVWEETGGGFPGAHFWIGRLGQGDGLVHFGIVLGCASAGIAFLAAAIAYLRRPNREYGWALLCFLSAIIIATAMLGIIRISE